MQPRNEYLMSTALERKQGPHVLASCCSQLITSSSTSFPLACPQHRGGGGDFSRCTDCFWDDFLLVLAFFRVVQKFKPPQKSCTIHAAREKCLCCSVLSIFHTQLSLCVDHLLKIHLTRQVQAKPSACCWCEVGAKTWNSVCPPVFVAALSCLHATRLGWSGLVVSASHLLLYYWVMKTFPLLLHLVSSFSVGSKLLSMFLSVFEREVSISVSEIFPL